MKRWYLLTVALYLLIAGLLVFPVTWLAFWPHADIAGFLPASPPAIILWIWAGVFGLAQALLLLVPIGSAERRPKARRKLLVPVITSALFMAVLVMSAVLCVVLVVIGKDGDNAERIFGSVFGGPDGAMYFVLSFGTIIALGWIFWGWLFYSYRKTVDPDLLTNRLMRWLLAGSILELLVAVPSHVLVRQRGDCCAPIGTFFGIACGISVMLLSFGPGVFFLFARRIDLLRNWPAGSCQKCGYDLRAHQPGQCCPECGTTIPAPRELTQKVK